METMVAIPQFVGRLFVYIIGIDVLLVCPSAVSPVLVSGPLFFVEHGLLLCVFL